MAESGRVSWSRHGAAVLAGCALLVLAVTGARYAAARHHVRAAREALDHDRAAEHLDRAAGLWPLSADESFLAARTARRRGDEAGAEARLEQCPPRADLLEALALERVLLRAQRGDLAQLEEPLQARAARAGPEAPFVLEALTRGYLRRRDWPGALGCANRLLSFAPSSAQAWLWRARAQEGHDHDEEACESYRRATALAPLSSEARFGLAGALRRTGELREALWHYEQSCRQDPGNVEARLGAVRCLHDLGDLAEAGRRLDELLRERADLVPALIERGRMAWRAGYATTAEQDFRRALELAPDRREPHAAWHAFLEWQGRTDEAARYQVRLRQAERQEVARVSVKPGSTSEVPKE